MLEDLFYHPKIHSTLRQFDLDHKLRHLFRIFKERQSGVRTLRTGGAMAMFYDFSLLDEKWLSTELKVLSDVLEELQTKDVFYDIGADAGLYSVFTAKEGSQNGNESIVGFEPHPIRRSSFNRNLKLNDVRDDVRIVPECLSNYNGETQVDYAMINNPGDKTKRRGFNATVRRGDDLVENSEISPPTILKIDVEGAEGEVISGLSEALTRAECRALYVEVHDKVENFGWSRQEVYDCIEEMGYSITQIAVRETEDHEEKFIKATK